MAGSAGVSAIGVISTDGSVGVAGADSVGSSGAGGISATGVSGLEDGVSVGVARVVTPLLISAGKARA